MGAWGVALFSDDTACDVRDEYRAALTEGLTPDAARDRVLDRFADALADPEEGPVVRLALAATAWKLGRLDAETRDRALEVIARGVGMDRWAEAGLDAKRARVLDNLAATLRQPQQAPAPMKPKRGFVSAWAVGEILGYRQATGLWLALHVVGHSDGGAGVFAVVNMLDWTGEAGPPTATELAQSGPVLFPPEWDLSMPKHADLCLLVTRKMEKDFARWGFHRTPAHRGPFDTQSLSYVGPALFERDIITAWRSRLRT